VPDDARAQVRATTVRRVRGAEVGPEEADALAVEEPLTVMLGYGPGSARERATVSVTMRTPGHDAELAAGLLVGEGVLRDRAQVAGTVQQARNRVLLELAPGVAFDPARWERRLYASSACGVCGRVAPDTGEPVMAGPPLPKGGPRVAPAVLHALPDALRAAQDAFDRTGGLHAAALFDTGGVLLCLREDVGRHNAVDKVIGWALLAGEDLSGRVLLVSGRVGFEVAQKAVMAGVPVLAAVGAPTTLAVEVADENDLTLVGFLRNGRFNIYSGAWRIVGGEPS
jgi:FdhD protein